MTGFDEGVQGTRGEGMETFSPTHPLTRSPLQGVKLGRKAWILLGITLAGAVLRVYLLGDKSIWLDEAFSIALSRHELGELLRLTVLTDAHPPLYYVALKFWTMLGTGEGIVRLLSALFSTAAIPMIYLLGSTLYEERGGDPLSKATSVSEAASEQWGLLAAAILAFSPFHIWYAQEARMYAMLTFFVLASATFLVKALRENERRYWGAYTVTTTLALYTDNGAIWYVVAVVLFSGYWVWRIVDGGRQTADGGLRSAVSRLRSERLARSWLLSHGAILLLYGPWLPFFVRQTQQVKESFWLPPPSFQTVLETFLDFNSFNFPWMGPSVLYITALLVWAYLTPNGGWQQRLATVWLFVPLVVSLLLSLRQPIFLSRNLIVASLGFYLLLVDTVRKFDSPRATVVLLAPLLLMNLVSIGTNAWVEEKEDWREMAQQVAAAVEAPAYAGGREDALILFVPYYAELPFAYYFEEHGVEVETQGYPQDEQLLHPKPQTVGSLEALLAERPVVWLVLRDVETVDPDWEVKAWLDSNGFVRGPQFEGEEVSALSYIRWDLVRDGAPAGAAAEAPDAGAGSEREEEAFSTYVPLVRSEPRVAATPTPAQRIHVIAPGDTLWELARDYGSSVQAIMEANGISSANRLRVGQELVIPVSE